MVSSTMKELYEEIQRQLEIQRFSDDQKTRKAAIAQEIHLRDHVQRIYDAQEEGMEQGIEQGKVEVIFNLYKSQFPVEVIADAVNMSVEDVLRIVKSDNQ